MHMWAGPRAGEMFWGDLLAYGVAGMSLITLLVYGLSTPWWKKMAGWNLMGMPFAIFMQTLLTLSVLEFGDEYAARPLFRALVYGVLFVLLAHRVWWVVDAQFLRDVPRTSRCKHCHLKQEEDRGRN